MAVRAPKQAAAVAPQRFDVVRLLGSSLFGMSSAGGGVGASADRMAEAEVHLWRAALIDPRAADVYVHRARALFDLNRAKEGMACADQALALNPVKYGASRTCV